MSLQAALKETGLNLEGDSLPKEYRNVKTFKRLIAAIRATEAAVMDDLIASQKRENAALQDKQEYQDRCHVLETELQQLRLKEKLSHLDAISTVDKERLLEVAK